MAIPSSNPSAPVDPNAQSANNQNDNTVTDSKPVNIMDVNESIKTTAPSVNPEPTTEPAPISIDTANQPITDNTIETQNPVIAEPTDNNTVPEINTTIQTPQNNLESLSSLKAEMEEAKETQKTVQSENQTDSTTGNTQDTADMKLHSTLPEDIIAEVPVQDENIVNKENKQEELKKQPSGNFWFKFAFLLLVALILGGLLIYLLIS